MDFSLIFIGSTHGFIKDFTKQEEIINSIDPEFVLVEDLEDISLDTKEKFKKLFKSRFISDMTSFSDVEDLIKLCHNKNIKLIGIDFHNFGFDKVLQEKIKKQEPLSKREQEKINKILESREKSHIKKILEYLKKTSKPLVVIVGSWHLRKGALLVKEMNNYKIIFPCDSEGNLLIEPPRDNKGIFYREITKNAN